MQLRYPRESMSESKKYIAIKEKQDGTHERNQNLMKYKAIFERNADRLVNANAIYEGQVIVLPAK